MQVSIVTMWTTVTTAARVKFDYDQNEGYNVCHDEDEDGSTINQ